MNKSTLIITLRSFNPKEIREFSEFVNSPFFNKNQAVRKLYDYIKKYYPNFDSDKLNRESIYRQLFGKSEYSESFMKTIIHILSNLCEKFLFHMNLQKKPSVEMLMTCDELNERKLEKLLLKTLKDTEKEIEKAKETNEKKYNYYRYEYFEIKNNYLEWTKFKNKNFRDYNSDEIHKMVESISAYFFETVLIAYRAVLTRREQWPIEFDEKIAEHIIEFLLKNKEDFKNYPDIILHLHELMLHKERSVKYYYLLKDQLINVPDMISGDKKYTLNTILQQYCLRKTTEGARGFAEERLELYKLSLDKEFYKLSSQQYFDQLLFGNIALTAIKLKEFEWAENFLNKYSSELSPEDKEVVLIYLKARLHFEKHEFIKSLEMLNNIKAMVHVQYKIIIRNLLLMLYYELSYYDQGEALYASYRKFFTLNKEHFSGERLVWYQNFLKYYIKLLKIKESGSKTGLDEVIVELKNKQNNIENSWLMEKTEELSGKVSG